ncbi:MULTISPECIES: histidine phosphatase family protein [unclassified Haladaptatus]|uniref:histidine phosphatase family protein n=1 Tax=unclassified Haladaptatus TaxID=2622732 RepID=UPI0023E816E3|nr:MULTISPECIES: histidine phosphatase family protein [unclassified Haladaptatus]
MRVLLVRHGETHWNRERRMQGWAPSRLTENGEQQARVTGETLAAEYDIAHIYASDLTRTRETTVHIRESVEADATFDSAWRERDLGVYQGLTHDEITERFPEFSLTRAGLEAAAKVPEGGESLVQVRDRVLSGWEDLTENHREGDTVLVVSHGGPMYLLLGHLQGHDIVESYTRLRLKNCSVSEIAVEEESRVVRENETPY